MEISEEEKDQIAAAYNNNASLREPALQFGRSVKARCEVLCERSVRVLPSNGEGSRSSTSNDDFFNVICREEQAYWLGWLIGSSLTFQLSPITALAL